MDAFALCGAERNPGRVNWRPGRPRFRSLVEKTRAAGRLSCVFAFAAASAATAVAPARAEPGAPAPTATVGRLAAAETPASAAATDRAAGSSLTAGAGSAPSAGVGVGSSRIVQVFPAAGELLVDAVAVRVTPSWQAPVIRVMRQFRPDYRLQEVFAVASRIGADGRAWYRVSVPMRPNGRMGWIPAQTVQLQPTVAKVEVHRRSRTIDLYWHGRRVWHAAIAVGAPGMETPLGRYYATARFVPHDNPYLAGYAVETSGYSKLSDWPGGGVFGIHGTNQPWLLGQAVSHGCIRVSKLTAAKLRRYVPLGTPILITDS